jgi:hypothetical protein
MRNELAFIALVAVMLVVGSTIEAVTRWLDHSRDIACVQSGRTPAHHDNKWTCEESSKWPTICACRL